MRITQRTMTNSSLAGIDRNRAALAKVQAELSSNRRLNRPSDSPVETGIAMQLRDEVKSNQQHAASAADAGDWLQVADTALSGMLDAVQQVKVLGVAALNSGATTDTAQAATAAAVQGLRSTLLDLANRTVAGRPVFGGSTGARTAYDPTSGAWTGQAGAPVTRVLSETSSVRVDITGVEAFGEPGDDLFAVVGRIAAAVVDDPASLGAHLADLDVAFGRLTTSATLVGARTNQVEAAAQAITDRGLALTDRLEGVENIDLPRTIIESKAQEQAYQVALQVASSSMQTTLMDYLR